MNLFIIGNGFDKAHRLPTDFVKDFKPIADDEFWERYAPDPDSFWSTFELSLATPEMSRISELLEDRQPDYTSDHEYDRDDVITFVDSVGNLYDALAEFADKAEQAIEQSCARECFWDWFQEDALFVNFNYTSTLEKLYAIDRGNILYIHGHVDESELIMGYKSGTLDLGQVPSDIDPRRSVRTDIYVEDIEDFYMRTAYDDLLRKIREFEKPCQIERLKAFLLNHCVDFIFVLGHSLGMPDRDYFDGIHSLFPNALWKISYHTETDIVIRNLRRYPFLNANCLFQL